MRVIVLIVLLLAANVAKPQGVVTDAFGIYLSTNIEGIRSHWSDLEASDQNSALILPFVGPKSLTAGGDKGHAIALIFDRFGNLIPDGKTLEFNIGGYTYNAASKNGIAEVFFAPGQSAGTFEVGISSGEAQSARSTYRVTADLAGIKPEVVAQEANAKLETFVEFKTNLLKDQFGNIAPSGLGAQLVFTHGDGSVSVMSPYVQGGKLVADFLVRDIPDGGLLQASFAGQHSHETLVKVAPMSLAKSTRIFIRAMPSIRAIEVDVGPVLTASGHVLNDGAEVRLSIETGSGRTVSQTGWLRDGHFKTVMAVEATDLPITVDLETALAKENVIFTSLPSSGAIFLGFNQ